MRRAEGDRRGPDRAAGARPYAGPERRQGPRREAELPSSIWRQPLPLALAIALGIAAGIGSGVTIESNARPQLEQRHDQDDRTEQPAAPLDPELLAGVQALRDEAEALTTAQVDLDERAHERWMPRVAMIERALDDPNTPAALRQELDATIHALECVGVLGPTPDADLCHNQAVNRSITPKSPS